MEKILYMWISGSIFIAVIICFRHFFFRQVPKRFFVFLWIVAMVRLLLPVSVAVPWPMAVRLQSFSLQVDNQKTDVDISNMHSLPEHTDDATGEADKIPELAFVDYNQIKNTGFLIWLALAVFIAFRILIKHVRCRRMYSLSLPICEKTAVEWLRTHHSMRKVDLRQSEMVRTPLTYGILRPVILLPSEMQFCREELLGIMEHEWMHIRWWDVLVKYVLYLTVCIYWFHPMVWVMAILLNRDMEIACDEEVIKKYSGSFRETYALILIRLAEGRQKSMRLVDARFTGQSEIEERIRMIMKPNKYSKKTIALALAMVLCAAATFTVAAKDSPEEVNVSSEEKEPETDSKAEGGTSTETNAAVSNMEAKDEILSKENASPENEEADADGKIKEQTQEETNTAAANATAINEQIAKLAGDYIGTHYVYGGEDLLNGVDSSGFVKAIYAQAGIELPRTINELAGCGTEVPLDSLVAGDVLIYGKQNEGQQVQLSHTGIYDGQGQVIHASNDRDGVKASDYDYRPISKAIRIVE